MARTERVRVRRLESVIDEIQGTLPSARIFVELDTQGYDLQVVRGAGARRDSIRALQTELAVRSMSAGMPTLAEGLAELNDLGFELTGRFPVTVTSTTCG